MDETETILKPETKAFQPLVEYPDFSIGGLLLRVSQSATPFQRNGPHSDSYARLLCGRFSGLRFAKSSIVNPAIKKPGYSTKGWKALITVARGAVTLWANIIYLDRRFMIKNGLVSVTPSPTGGVVAPAARQRLARRRQGGLGRIVALCATAPPPHTGFTSFDATVSEESMRPNPATPRSSQRSPRWRPPTATQLPRTHWPRRQVRCFWSFREHL
jgi:hypothetical protein